MVSAKAAVDNLQVLVLLVFATCFPDHVTLNVYFGVGFVRTAISLLHISSPFPPAFLCLC